MRFYYTFCSIQNYQLIADLLIRGGECDFLFYNSPLHSHTDDNVPDTNVIGHYESYKKIPVKYSYIFLVVLGKFKGRTFSDERQT